MLAHFLIKLNTYSCTSERENEEYKHQKEKNPSKQAFNQMYLLV